VPPGTDAVTGGQPIFSVWVPDREVSEPLRFAGDDGIDGPLQTGVEPEPEPVHTARILASGTSTVAPSGRRIRLVTEQLLPWV
jgi:hypothetical protein